MAGSWQKGEIDLPLIDVTFGDYILMLCSEFATQVSSNFQPHRYCALKSLFDEITTLRSQGSTSVDAFEAEWSKSRARFWGSEFQLYRLFGDLPELRRSNNVDFP